jgi:membrane-associated phospholipid phosphatase
VDLVDTGSVDDMNMRLLFLILAIVFLAIGLAAMFWGKGSLGDIIEGGSKGLAGVFFVLYYILMLLEKQPTDKTTH